MKTGIRTIICTALVSAAFTASAFTLSGFRPQEAPAVQESLYMLRESEGKVAVFHRDDPEHPMLVSGIELSSLRETDRDLIRQGLPVDTPEELACLLEDLGT